MCITAERDLKKQKGHGGWPMPLWVGIRSADHEINKIKRITHISVLFCIPHNAQQCAYTCVKVAAQQDHLIACSDPCCPLAFPGLIWPATLLRCMQMPNARFSNRAVNGCNWKLDNYQVLDFVSAQNSENPQYEVRLLIQQRTPLAGNKRVLCAC